MKRIHAELDLPANAADLLSAAKREACRVAEIAPEAFDTNPAARMFSATMLAHVRAGGRAYCTNDRLGPIRGNAMVGRPLGANTSTDMRRSHPGWVSAAERAGSKLVAVWSGEEKGRAA